MLTAVDTTNPFASAARVVDAVLLYLPSSVRWLFVAWAVVLLLVRAASLRADSERASDERAPQPARAAFAVATEPVSLVEPDVRVCTECSAPVDPPVNDLLRGLFEPEPPLMGLKPGMPPWGTSPLATDANDAQARRFRQMISDAIRRQQAR